MSNHHLLAVRVQTVQKAKEVLQVSTHRRLLQPTRSQKRVFAAKMELVRVWNTKAKRCSDAKVLGEAGIREMCPVQRVAARWRCWLTLNMVSQSLWTKKNVYLTKFGSSSDDVVKLPWRDEAGSDFSLRNHVFRQQCSSQCLSAFLVSLDCRKKNKKT